MSNVANSVLINDESQKNSYKINIITNFENDDKDNNKEEKKDNVNNSILKSKTTKNKNLVKNVLENSFKEKKSNRNNSIDQKNNSLFFQNINSINKGHNISNIFYTNSISPIKQNNYKKNYNKNYNLNVMKLANQLYGNEEHLKKRIVSSKNVSSNMSNVSGIKSNQKMRRFGKESTMYLSNYNNGKKIIKSSKVVSKFYSQNKLVKKENKSIIILNNSDKKKQENNKNNKNNNNINQFLMI
jgi:hypothetical protein